MSMHPKQNGFTVIELIISTMVFSVFLLMLTFLTMRIGRLFQKGILSSRTQETARAISSEITRAIQFSGNIPTTDTTTYICAGSQRYMFILGQQEGVAVPHALIADNLAVCPGAINMAAFAPATQRELIPDRMRLAQLRLVPSGTNLYTLTVRIVYGDDDLLNNPNGANADCRTNVKGTEYCAMSELTTTVQKRL